MRVSDKLRYDTVQSRVERSKQANMREMDRIASQKDIQKLSDDPIGATQGIKLRDTLGNIDHFKRNINFSKGLLERSETALRGIADNLIRCKELAIGMANDTFDANSREASSREVREIMDELVALGNTTFNGRYIFGGFRNLTPPLNLDGDYMGDDGAIFLQIGRNNFRQVNVQSRYLFEATPDEKQLGHFNMINTVEMLYEGLHQNDKYMITKAIDELEHQLEKTTSNQATVGGMWKSLNDTFDRLDNETLMNRKTLSEVEDADMYDASSEFKRTETTLQGTLMASTKLLQPSLLNFLQ